MALAVLQQDNREISCRMKAMHEGSCFALDFNLLSVEHVDIFGFSCHISSLRMQHLVSSVTSLVWNGLLFDLDSGNGLFFYDIRHLSAAVQYCSKQAHQHGDLYEVIEFRYTAKKIEGRRRYE